MTIHVANRFLPLLLIWLFSMAAVGLNLNMTAITAKNGISRLECWQLSSPFSESTMPGFGGGSITAQLGSVTNVSISVFPAQYATTPHNSALNQYVFYTNGLARYTVPPDNGTTVMVEGGEFGMTFSGDTPAVSKTGHSTEYPGLTETIAVLIPTKDNKVPDHTVLHSGPCNVGETTGLRDFATAGLK